MSFFKKFCCCPDNNVPDEVKYATPFWKVVSLMNVSANTEQNSTPVFRRIGNTTYATGMSIYKVYEVLSTKLIQESIEINAIQENIRSLKKFKKTAQISLDEALNLKPKNTRVVKECLSTISNVDRQLRTLYRQRQNFFENNGFEKMCRNLVIFDVEGALKNVLLQDEKEKENTKSSTIELGEIPGAPNTEIKEEKENETEVLEVIEGNNCFS